MSILSKIFGDANEKFVKNLQPIVERINLFEPEFEKLSAEGLKEKTKEFKERLAKGDPAERGRNLEEIFKKGDPPADQYDADQSQVLKPVHLPQFQVAVPRKRHKGV